MHFDATVASKLPCSCLF